MLLVLLFSFKWIDILFPLIRPPFFGDLRPLKRVAPLSGQFHCKFVIWQLRKQALLSGEHCTPLCTLPRYFGFFPSYELNLMNLMSFLASLLVMTLNVKEMMCVWVERVLYYITLYIAEQLGFYITSSVVLHMDVMRKNFFVCHPSRIKKQQAEEGLPRWHFMPQVNSDNLNVYCLCL